jgi:hypothetical protein
VSVLVVESGDVHELHAPEYCLTGSGWVLGTPAATAAAAGDGPGLPLTAAAAEISGEGAGQALAGVYWFSSASLSTADLAGLRLRSRLAPGEPFTLYLVTAVESAAPAARRQLTAFLREAPWLGATPGDGGG